MGEEPGYKATGNEASSSPYNIHCISMTHFHLSRADIAKHCIISQISQNPKPPPGGNEAWAWLTCWHCCTIATHHQTECIFKSHSNLTIEDYQWCCKQHRDLLCTRCRHFWYQNFDVIYSVGSSYRASLRGIPISIPMQQELMLPQSCIGQNSQTV